MTGRRAVLVAAGAIVLIAAGLTVNALVTNSETKAAGVNVAGGSVLDLPGGDVQVTERGPLRPTPRRRKPIVLMHCYGCSLRWWDRVEPLLARRHRVIRVDLLGHGGSEKPQNGYSIENQANTVAQALERLGVEGAVVVGHSLGAVVGTELAARRKALVDRFVDIGMGATASDLPLTARLGYVPLLGQAIRQVVPDSVVKDNYAEAFAPGYDPERGFADPDQVVDDFRAMTYTSYDRISSATDDYTAERPLDERLAAARVPLLVIFGAEDRIFDDARRWAYGFDDVPHARIVLLSGVGHSPNVERPVETARLIRDFAADRLPGRP